MIRRACVRVDGRRVHYRWRGDGVPVVLLHASPESSSAMSAQLNAYGKDHLAIALDTPGYGFSDPLPHAAPAMVDYANALAATLDALGLPRVGLVGRHTGAAIAVEFARLNPDRVAGLICDGLPIYSAERRSDYLANYVARNPPRWDGAHLIQAWFRFREQHVYWPWFKQHPAARADTDLPTTQQLHRGCLNLLLSGETSGTAELAVFRYEMANALRQLRVPTLVATRDGDSLYRRMAMLKDLPDTISVKRLERGAGPLSDVERAALRPALLSPPTPWPVQPAHGPRLAPTFIDFRDGQVAARVAGSRQRNHAILVLPDTPLGGALLEPALEELGARHPVACIDAPGSGDSSATMTADPLDGIVQAAEVVLTALSFKPDAIVGLGLGGFAAHRLATSLGLNPNADVVSLPTMTDETASAAVHDATLFADLSPDRHGLHLARTWHQLRDHMLWRPAGRGRRQARLDADMDTAALHKRVIELMKNPANARPYLMAHAQATVAGPLPANPKATTRTAPIGQFLKAALS